MNSSEYKSYHESFMQNNHGSTAFHTFFCIFFTVQCSVYSAIQIQKTGATQYIYEFIIIVLPLVAAHTIMSSYIYVLNLVLLTFLVYELAYHCSKFEIVRTFMMPNNFRTNHIHSISILRGLTYLITVFCILAVDFQAFPRYLAKTEMFGYSLMDTGVGLFVIMSGLVHKDLSKNKVSTIIKSNAKFISVLVFLGFARFISVKQLDYQEHVTEYGVHWNFFFTLAVCKLLSTILLYITDHALFLSVLTIFAHEYMLYCGLQDWVLSDTPRIDFLTANREGISSSLGYVSLYLFAAFIKRMLSDKSIPRFVVLLNLILGSVLLWVILSFTDVYHPTSRTLANGGYCIYLAAVLMTVLSIMYYFEVLFQDKDKNLYFNVPLLLSAVNENGLIYFLVANLITGAVNMSVTTLFTSTSITLLILNGYMIVTIALAVCFRSKSLKI